MSDLIDRQAAIDALKYDMAQLDHIIKGMSGYDVRLDAYVSQRNQVNCDIDTINNLPTAQPEIIRCKDCKFNRGGYKCLYPDSIIKVPNDNDFCSYGERRTNERSN